MLARRKPLVRRTPLRRRRRPRPSGDADEALLDRFRARRSCEWCGRKLRHAAHPHHIHTRGAGRVDLPCNLVALCWRCHRAAHDGTIPRLQLLMLAAERERMTVAEAQAIVWRIRRS